MDPTRRLFGIFFLPPITWAAHLGVAYALHEQACASSTRLMLWIVSVVAIAVIAANGVLSLRAWRGSRRDVDRFLALAALILTVFFGLVVIGQTIPQFLLRPCD